MFGEREYATSDISNPEDAATSGKRKLNKTRRYLRVKVEACK